MRVDAAVIVNTLIGENVLDLLEVAVITVAERTEQAPPTPALVFDYAAIFIGTHSRVAG